MWEPWFAIPFVWVDAYDESETKNGKTRYRVWFRWVRRCWVKVVDDETGETWTGWRYRP